MINHNLIHKPNLDTQIYSKKGFLDENAALANSLIVCPPSVIHSRSELNKISSIDRKEWRLLKPLEFPAGSVRKKVKRTKLISTIDYKPTEDSYEHPTNIAVQSEESDINSYRLHNEKKSNSVKRIKKILQKYQPEGNSKVPLITERKHILEKEESKTKPISISDREIKHLIKVVSNPIGSATYNLISEPQVIQEIGRASCRERVYVLV